MKRKILKRKTLNSLTVVGTNIVVDRIIEDVITAEGLAKSPQDEDKAFKGKVMRVGGDVNNVKEGDIIYFNEYSHTVFIFEDQEYSVLQDEDVIAVEK